MKWGDISNEHHRRMVSVSAKSTPKNPINGVEPVIGYIHCKVVNQVPYLENANGVNIHMFAWYYDVEFLD